VEQPRDLPLDVLLGLREETAETRATVRHLVTNVADVKHDLRRLDDRVFQLLLVQFATLITALASLATALLTALAA
jgi:hypothetical protein